jgi:hypothetical protein
MEVMKPGERVGPDELASPIGAGGMGKRGKPVIRGLQDQPPTRLRPRRTRADPVRPAMQTKLEKEAILNLSLKFSVQITGETRRCCTSFAVCLRVR